MARHVALIMAFLFAVVTGSVQAAHAYTITVTTTKGGVVTPLGKQTVDAGANLDVTMTASAGYYLSEIKVDGVPQTVTDRASQLYSFAAVSANHTIAAKFSANPVITSSSNAGGTITPLGKTTLNYGGSQSYAIAANTGYHIVDVLVDGASQGAVSSYDFSNVTTKHKIAAKFQINSYSVTASAGPGGKITPVGLSTAKHGTKKMFTVTPDKGYHITSVTVNGVEQQGIPSSGLFKLSIYPITENLVITASFDVIVVSGLSVASQVSVVDAQQANSSAALLQALKRIAALAPPPADSDYYKDTTNVYVSEKSGEAFKTVNQILCMVNQTKYSDSALLNHGYYKAMIDSQVCQGNDSADNSSSSSQAGTSASAAPSYDVWTVKSERASETSPHIFSAYVHMAKGGPMEVPMTVEAKMVITEGVSESNPLGIFTMNYRGFPDDNPALTMMKGVLKTQLVDGKVVIRFAEQEGNPASPNRIAKAAYSRDDVTKTGQGSAYMLENYGQQTNEGSIDFAYNTANFLRVDPVGPTSVCLDRTRFETSAWRYGLYDATSGSRATLNGGFPINTKEDGTGYYGYLGYYGLNLPPGAAALADGDYIYKMVWDNGTRTVTPYTLFVRGGKLKKHTRSTITLDTIKNIPLEGNIPVPGSNGPGSTMYRLTWDGAQLAIRASAQMTQGGPPTWVDQNPPIVIDSSYVLPYSNLGLYSQALGGQLNIQFSGCTPVQQNNPNMGVTCTSPGAATTVVFYKEDTVNPADTVPASLACYDNCPKAGAAGMDGTSQQNMTYQTFNTRHDYSFTDMLLRDGANPAVLTSTPPGQPWGFSSGPLFDPASIALLACDWDPQQTCGWKAWNTLDVFYTWETGPNSWNQFSAVKDGNGQPVVFDAPWQVEYTHHQADANAYDRKYDGTTFFLQYSGFGDLQGIPGRCVDPNDPSAMVMDCSQQGMRWVPEFTIPAGSLALVNSADYLVKPLDVEQRMAKANGGCVGMSVTDMSGSWPNVNTDWVDPALPAEPKITDPPKVIGGVIQ